MRTYVRDQGHYSVAVVLIHWSREHGKVHTRLVHRHILLTLIDGLAAHLNPASVMIRIRMRPLVGRTISSLFLNAPRTAFLSVPAEHSTTRSLRRIRALGRTRIHNQPHRYRHPTVVQLIVDHL